MAARKSRKKVSRASREAAAALKGAASRPEPQISFPEHLGKGVPGRFAWLNRPVAKGLRITWKAVVLFLLFCLMADVILFLVLKFGFDSCYGMLCLMN